MDSLNETPAPDKPSVLCVDDEPNVLTGLKLTLRSGYSVLTAGDAVEAITLLEETPAIAVVISDMRMPEVDGATFLSRVRARWPETTRILLTGDVGRDAAIAAVNEGQIFRFLTKPCSAPTLTAAVDAAYRQFQLVTAEKTLLQQTLMGSINALVDLLGIVNPAAFGRAGRVKRLCLELNRQLGNAPSWELEAAALLSQIGYAALPTNTVMKLYQGKSLSQREAASVGVAPLTAAKLLTRIPRMERVAAIVQMATTTRPRHPAVADELAALAGILALVLEVDLLVSAGDSPFSALERLRAKADSQSKSLIEALFMVIGDSTRVRTIKEIPLRDVKLGMILLTDVRLDNGALMICRDYEISPSFMQRVHNFKPALLAKIVRVAVARNPPS